MVKMTLLYFTSLLKIFFVFIPLNLLASMLFMNFNYSFEIGLALFINSIQLSFIPLILFQHTLFLSLYLPSQFPLQIKMLLLITLISSFLLMISLPFTNNVYEISLKNIEMIPINTENTSIQTTKGTLILDPKKIFSDILLFKKKSVKALWIDDNYLMFQDLKKVSSSYILSDPVNMKIFGYSIPKGSKIISSLKLRPKSFRISFCDTIITNIFFYFSSFNQTIHKLLQHIGIQEKSKINKTLKSILRQKPLKYKNIKDKMALESLEKRNLKELKNKSPWIQTMLKYSYILLFFLVILSIVSITSIVIITNQTPLASFILAGFLTLVLAKNSNLIYLVGAEIQKKFPQYSLLLLNTGMFLGLSLVLLIILFLKNNKRQIS